MPDRLTPQQRRAQLRRERHNASQRPFIPPPDDPADLAAEARAEMAYFDRLPLDVRAYVIEHGELPRSSSTAYHPPLPTHQRKPEP